MKQFKSKFMQFFTLKQGSLLLIHEQIGVTLLTKLRLKFSHLHEHKFRHKFKYCVIPMWNYGADNEIT